MEWVVLSYDCVRGRSKVAKGANGERIGEDPIAAVAAQRTE